MPYSLQQLSDAEDIKVLKHRYFRAIDTADEALLRTMFTDDVAVEYRGGEYLVSLTGNEAMIEFVLNSFHAGVAGMHHGHMPEITFTGADDAEGIWYLEDIFVDLERNVLTIGSALYKDRYKRVNGEWKIARTEYDRILELVEPIRPELTLSEHYLAKHGRKGAERGDISHLITWFNK
jgi:SnoaL-like domain